MMMDNSESRESQIETNRELSKPEGDAGGTERAKSSLPDSSKPVNSSVNAPEASGIKDFKDRMLGEIRLLRCLGRGGMADVFLADQTSLKRQLAIKVLRPDFVSDQVYVKRFEREATTAAGLNHPNIIQVYAIGETDGVHYIAQEYVQGWNLREFLIRNGPPSFTLALHIMKQVASALQVAGEAGVVHRDIKPENIMITRTGRVKVADFGIAQLTLAGERVNLTQDGITMGTPLYMSPEQVNGDKVDQRSDIYSFGVTCYHLLAKHPPFQGDAMSVAVKHLTEEPEPLIQRRPDLPRQICTIIHKMMAKHPDNRFPDAKAVLKDLNRIDKTTHPTQDRFGLDLSDWNTSGGRQVWIGMLHSFTWHAHRKLFLYLIACLLLAVVASGIGWLSRPGNPLDAPVQAKHKIQKQRTASAQYYLALSLVDDEDAWKAVRQHFPDAILEIQRADENLAMLYLSSHRLDDAEQIFKMLSSLSDDDVALKAQGIAGLSVIACLRGDHQQSQRTIAVQLYPIRTNLDRQMESLVREAINQNRSFLDTAVAKGYEELFNSGPDQRDLGQPRRKGGGPDHRDFGQPRRKGGGPDQRDLGQPRRKDGGPESLETSIR